MIGKKINQLATELAPTTTDLTIIGDPVTGVSKKITLEQLGAIFGGAVSFYTTLGDFPATGVIDIIYCAKDTKKLYLWSGSAYVEVFPSQSLLDTYQLRSEKGVSNGYASLDSGGKVPISQLPSSIMEYKGTWNAATNTPTLANGTGDTGDVYICNVAGTVNFGAGPLTFAVGDYVIYSGSIWQRSSGAVGTVTSVAVSRSGDALAITGSPITTSGTINIGFAGTTAQYLRGDGTLATFPSIISQAQNLVTEVYNRTGATLTKGTIVYINGGQGNLPTVTKALATGDSTSAQTYGVVQTDITNMNNGYVVAAGRLTDLDTQAYTEGTQLYLSATTAGTWTPTKQYAPNHLVYVGIVVRAHPTQGVVEVKIQNGYEMDELHNVAAQSPDNNDILQYKTATSLWTKVAGTTTNIAEGTNLYYTDARSRAALSFTAGSGAYNSTTGVITIPTNTNQLTNGAAFITLASLSAGAGISYNNTTGVIASTITQYTDALARAAISLTTTGTSGAATYNNTTGVLNIPQYQTALTNPVTGTGTTNYLPKFTGTSTIGDSSISDNGTGRVSIGTTSFNDSFVISNSGAAGWEFSNSGSVITYNRSTSAYIPMTFEASNYILNRGNLGLGVTPSAWGSILNVNQLGNYGAFIAGRSDSVNQIFIGVNGYYNGTSWLYSNSSSASRYYQDNAKHIWDIAPSGTAGNAISFTQAMTLNASGNLSVGNTNDSFKLEVTGEGRFYQSATSSTAYLRIENNRSRNAAIYTATTNGGFYAGTSIGTDTFQYQIYDAVAGSSRLTIASTGAATFSSSVTANYGGTFIIPSESPASGNVALIAKTSNGANDIFRWFDGATQLGVFKNSGNVGIGTTSPTEILHLNKTSGTGTFIRFQDTGGDGVYVGSRSNNLELYAGGAERMRITSGGNVGIGTTTSAWSLGKTLQIGGDNGAINFSGTAAILGIVNAYYNGSSYIHQNTGTVASFEYGLAVGNSFNWRMSPSANAGSTASLGVVMSLSNAGNLEIATGSIKTGAPSSGSAHPWKLGSYAAGGTGTATGVIYIEVNGQIYSIPALLGTP